LNLARRGSYPKRRISKNLPDHVVERHFDVNDETMAIKADVKTMVTFLRGNLIEEIEQLGIFDVIFCRNVMIYFSTEARRRTLERLFKILHKGGFLFLGASETTYNLSDRFKVVHVGPTTYYKRVE
jgi:chemotaxis protein methyltransferase CheR